MPTTEQTHTRPRQAFLTLRTRILNGTIPPGTRLTLRPTAKNLGVGMNAVGEALRELEHEGLVDLEPRIGARVRVRDAAAVRSDFILRIAIECEAVRQVAAKGEPGSFRVLSELATRVDDLACGDDLHATREADMKFHRAVAHFSEVTTLQNALASLLPRLVVLDQVAASSPAHAPAKHTPLVDKMREGEDKAAHAMREHITDAMYWGLGTGFTP